MLSLIRQVDSNWYEGRSVHGGASGIFPISYVETVVEPQSLMNTPMSSLAASPLPGSLSVSFIVIRPRRSRSAAAYSRQTFPWTICRSVRTYIRCRSVCPLHCGKTADRIRMPFGIIGRTGPGMRQVVEFGNRSTGRGILGPNLGRAIVTNGTLRRTCAAAPRRGLFPKLLWADLLTNVALMT